MVRTLGPLALALVVGAGGWSGGATAWAAGGRVLLVAAGEGEEAALVDELRISTRDLGVEVETARGPARHADAPGDPERARLLERMGHEGLCLMLWLGEGAARRTATLVALADDGAEWATTVPRRGGLLPRTLALKVRALLARQRAGRAGVDHAPEGWTVVALADPPRKVALDDLPADAPRPTAKPTVAPAASPQQGPAPPAAPAKATPEVTPPSLSPLAPAAPTTGGPPAPRPPVEVWLGLGLGTEVPTSAAASSWTRAGGVLRLAVLPRRIPLALTIDALGASPASSSAPPPAVPGCTAASSVSVWDVPAGLTAAWAPAARGRLSFLVGGRAAAHVLLASSRSACLPAAGTTTRLGASLGLAGEGRLALTGRLALALSLGLDGLLPDHRFTVEAQPVSGSLGPLSFRAALALDVRLN